MAGSTLIVTNDFGPRVGGIEAFVQAMAIRMAADDPKSVVVHTARQPGDQAFDAELPYRVVRDPSRLMVPTPAITRRCAETAREYGCDRVWFGSAAPLALMTPALRRAGVRRAVATTHSAEEWWSRLPVTSGVMRRIGERVDTVTYLGEYSRRRLAAVFTPAATQRMRRLPPGVDVARYRPDVDGSGVRQQLGLMGRPVVASISRLIRRKGQDVLIRAWPQVLAEYPDAVLVIVGDGPYRTRLQAQVTTAGLEESVILTGRVTWAQTPEYYAAADVFALPTRTRLAGLEPEGVPICLLEAQASGLPVVVGDSGGAPDTFVDGVSGHLVDGREPGRVAQAVLDLLGDPARARRWGRAGREHVTEGFQWDRLADRLGELLDPDLDHKSR